jgi:glycosyltransferase involved in cell wall biosynthesis
MSMNPRPTTLFISNVEWGFVWQRHQTLAAFFARDSEVIFCEVPGTRRLRWADTARVWRRLLALGRRHPAEKLSSAAGVRMARPFLLPATNRWFCAVNARLLARFVRRDAVLSAGVDLVVNYSPSRSALQLIARVPHRRLIYDCTDNWLAVRGIPGFLPEDERALLARADLTLVPSRRLEELKHPEARRLVRVPHGALVERFLLEPRRREANAPVTVLYYGHLHAQHLDFGLIDDLARARPAWHVVLVGPVKTPHAFPANVRLAGQQPHEKLRESIAEADALLLPYVLNDYTRAVLPAKIYECLATGRPIVATPLPELTTDFAGCLRFATDGPGLATAVEDFLASDTNENRTARVALAQANTWEQRYGQIRSLLAGLDAGEASG